MNKLDTYLLNKHQSFSGKFQDWFGKNNFFLGRISIILSVFFFIVSAFVEAQGNKVYIIIAVPFPCVVGIFLYIASYGLEKEFGDKPEFMNPLVLWVREYRPAVVVTLLLFKVDIIVRMFKLIVSHEYRIKVANPTGQLIGDSSDLLSTILIGCFFYFISCTPKPPKSSKIKQLTDKVIEKVRELAPGPSVVPG